MTIYLLTSSLDGQRRALVSGDGQRLEFPTDDGGLLADMLADEFPLCFNCESRSDMCLACGQCEGCDYCLCDAGEQPAAGEE